MIVYIKPVSGNNSTYPSMPCFLPIDELKHKQGILEIKYKKFLEEARNSPPTRPTVISRKRKKAHNRGTNTSGGFFSGGKISKLLAKLSEAQALKSNLVCLYSPIKSVQNQNIVKLDSTVCEGKQPETCDSSTQMEPTTTLLNKSTQTFLCEVYYKENSTDMVKQPSEGTRALKNIDHNEISENCIKLAAVKKTYTSPNKSPTKLVIKVTRPTKRQLSAEPPAPKKVKLSSESIRDELVDEVLHSIYKSVFTDILSPICESFKSLRSEESCSSSTPSPIPADTQLWDPTRLAHEDLMEYLLKVRIQDLAYNSLPTTNDLESEESLERKGCSIQDEETALILLHHNGYDIKKALNERELQLKAFNCSLSPVKKNEVDVSFITWDGNLKLLFEKGLVRYGENMDKIHKLLDFKDSHIEPNELQLYFYSSARQNFISRPNIASQIVSLLDKTSHNKIQSLETFEVSMDWARMREKVLSSSSSSDSDNLVCNTYYTQSGRQVNTMQQLKKRSRKLPVRFRKN